LPFDELAGAFDERAQLVARARRPPPGRQPAAPGAGDPAREAGDLPDGAHGFFFQEAADFVPRLTAFLR
jgi:hypothetical protein